MPTMQMQSSVRMSSSKRQEVEIHEMLSKIAARCHGEDDIPITLHELRTLTGYIHLLQRQAMKAANQRKALRQLNRAHRMIVLENRWLHGVAKESLGTRIWYGVLRTARESLWAMFRRETRPNRKGA